MTFRRLAAGRTDLTTLLLGRFARMTWLKLFSILACVALLVGYAYRRRPRVHVPLMVTAFVVDMAIVAYIEIDRDAIATAEAHMSPLMVVHIAISVAVILLYFGQIASGIRNVRGKRSRWHRLAGPSLILLRLGNLVTSFMVS